MTYGTFRLRSWVDGPLDAKFAGRYANRATLAGRQVALSRPLIRFAILPA